MTWYSFFISHYLFSMKGDIIWRPFVDLQLCFSYFDVNAFLKNPRNSIRCKYMGSKFSHSNRKSKIFERQCFHTFLGNPQFPSEMLPVKYVLTFFLFFFPLWTSTKIQFSDLNIFQFWCFWSGLEISVALGSLLLAFSQSPEHISARSFGRFKHL